MNGASREKSIWELLLGPKDRVMIRALSGEKTGPEAARLMTEGMDAERENALFLLLLAVIGLRQGWEGFPQEEVARLKGIHRYFQALNSAAAPKLTVFADLMDRNGLPFMLSGSAAMRAAYAPDTPRMMKRYDVTLPSERFGEGVKLLEEFKNGAGKDPAGSGESFGIELKRGTPDKRLFSEKSVWDRAAETVFMNRRILVPSREDMLLQLICVPFGPFMADEKGPDRIRRLSDILKVSEGVSEEKLANAARASGLSRVLRLYAAGLAELDPLPEKRPDWDFFLKDPEDEAFLKGMERACSMKLEFDKAYGDGSSAPLHRKAALKAARAKALILTQRPGERDR